MSKSRTDYWQARHAKFKAAKAAAKSTGKYPSLAGCLGLTDEAVIKTYADHGWDLPTLEYFDDEPFSLPGRTDNPPAWTDADRMAHRATHDANERLMQRGRLFSLGRDAYIATLSDASVVQALKKLAPESWEATSTRYTTSKELRSALAHLLYVKEIQHGT